MDNVNSNNVSEVGTSNTVDVSQPVAQTQEVNERIFKQSQVNAIVGEAKREAVEAYKRMQQQQAPQQSQTDNRNFNYLAEDDIRRLSSEEIRRQFQEMQEKATEQANVAAANRIVNTFREKISTGKDKYEDFNNVVDNINIGAYPNVVQLLADHVDNSSDVLYHLARNRTKLYELENFYAHNATDAIYEIKRLADSLKANEQSGYTKQANAPLSQQRPSNASVAGSGALSVKDYKKMFKG